METGSGDSRGPVRRRDFVRGAAGIALLGILGGPPLLALPRRRDLGFGPLRGPDANGLRLPDGFVSRVVATSGEVVEGTDYVWHGEPDGGACFATGDGGWVYVSNSELRGGRGGVGVLRFDAGGAIVAAYPILSGTTRNCAGGPTPWGTWLSCEEFAGGRVWECDPLAPGSRGIVRPALGVFDHEAAAVDPASGAVYLTEDLPDGLLYRFRPEREGDLSAGVLEALEVVGELVTVGVERGVRWHRVPRPREVPTRTQVAAATRFAGGEGAWCEGGLLYFTTKGDDRVWRFDLANELLSIVYDRRSSATPHLDGVDNVYVTPRGDVWVAEDGRDLEIVAVGPGNTAAPIVQLTGVEDSEITGPCLSPDGTRLYFSSQRNPGRTYEVRGPFLG